MALLTTMPPSMRHPIADCRFRVVSVKTRVNRTPAAPRGTVSMTSRGSPRDSYWEASTI
jgi:hypothetical protein